MISVMKRLLIISKTWMKPSEELYDYDNLNYRITEIGTKYEGIIVKEKFYNVKFLDKSETTDFDNKVINVEINDNNFYLKFYNNHLDFIKPELVPWLIIKNLESIKGVKEYKLTVGDIIKLGRVKLIVKEVNHNERVIKEKKTFENEKNDIVMTKSEKQNVQDNCVKNITTLHYSHIRIPSKMTITSSSRNNLNEVSTNNHKFSPEKITLDDNERTFRKRICRICLEEYDPSDQSSQNNILVNPCKCSGSTKYIHFDCLQTWLKSKAIVNSLLTPSCNYYEIMDVECEICKIIYPGK